MADNLTPKEEFLLNPVTEHNITDAAIASFETNLKHPVKVTIPITPQQDLHGYDHPWPAGSGKNKFNPSVVTWKKWNLNSNVFKTVADSSSIVVVTVNGEEVIIKVTVGYYGAGFEVAAESFDRVVSASNSTISAVQFWSAYEDNATRISTGATSCTIPANTAGFVAIRIDAARTETINIQIEAGSSSSSWAPYSNICPIIGRTGANVVKAQRNLLNLDDVHLVSLKIDNSLQIRHGVILQKAGKYCIKAFSHPYNGIYFYAKRYEKNGTWNGDRYIVAANNNYNVEITINDGDKLYLFNALDQSAEATKNIIIDFQITCCLDEYAETYEPYHGATIPINWQTEAGTIYGGTFTLNEDGSADVVATMAKTVFNGTQAISNVNWRPNATSVGWLYSNSLTPGIKVITSSTNIPNIVSNVLPTVNYEIVYGGTTDCISEVPNSSTFGIAMRSTDTSLTTQTAINAYLTQHPVEVIYELATPLTYHFPNIGQLKAFLGQNNVWSDAGNVNVKYLTQNSATGLEYRGDRALELRRRAMIGDAPTIHTTVGSEETGGLASFKSYIKAPVKKIEIPFGPKQDLHGYDNPWPAGGGKNLYNPDNRTETSDNTYYITELLANTQYTFSVDVAQSGLYVTYDNDGTWTNLAAAYNKTALSFNTGEHTLIRLMTYSSSRALPTKYQLELGSTATAYAPYSNICPIEGWDGANIEQREKNLFDSSTLAQLSGVVVNEDGSVYVANNNSIYDKVAWRNTKDYIGQIAITYRYKYANAGAVGAFPKIVYTDGTTQGPGPSNSQTFVDHTFVSNSNKQVDYVTFSYGTGDNSTTFFLQIEIGSVATDYEPYHGTTLPITFNQSGDHEFLPIQEGTGDPSPENVRPIYPGLTFTRDDDSVLSVYGGTLTVNADGTGNISSKYDSAQIKNFGWTIDTATATYHAFYGQNTQIANSQIYCDIFKYVGNHSYGEWRVEGTYNYGIGRLSNDGRIVIREDSKANASAFTTAYGENWIVYPVVTPTTYTLSVAETNRALEALGLTQHIGPIYGGTVTINPDRSADVVSDRAMFKIGDCDSYSQPTVGNAYEAQIFRAAVRSIGNATYDVVTGGISNQLTEIRGYFYSKYPDRVETEFGKPCFAFQSSNNGVYSEYFTVYIPSTQYLTAADFKEAVKDIEICVILPVADRQTYHFSNLEQLKVWLGENNFWCDISDDITVKYWNRG